MCKHDSVASLVGAGRLDALLTQWVFTCRTADVTVFPEPIDWVCHPYDAGIDIVAASPEQAAQLASMYTDWTSKRPDGL